MRAPLIGFGVVALLICMFLLTYQFPSWTLWSIGVRVFLGFFAVVFFGGYWLRQKRLREWVSAYGRIESCSLGRMDEGLQEYCCIYMFTVDGARQAGEVRVSDRPNRLEEIKRALVGQQVTVKYAPHDCTNSIIEETTINGWTVS